MRFRKLLCGILSAVLFTSQLTAYAGTNWDSGNAADLTQALDGENVWRISDDSGNRISCAEGLRVSVYDSETERKVFNTIDITGNALVSGVSGIRYFSDENEYIPKTSWLKSAYVGTTYNAIDEQSKTKFHNVVQSKWKTMGYSCNYVPSLSSITIISENNTANLEAIRQLIGKKEFLVRLCTLISGLEYSDFEAGKYKIAFEPIAYMTIAGNPWVLSATECGILDKYMLDILGTTTGALKTKMGPLTHSQLPLSAFLTYKELGVPVFASAESDIAYSTTGEVRYRNSCIIRCMGIGVLSGIGGDDETHDSSTTLTSTVAEYHTDTDVYTSFTVTNIGETPFVGSTIFHLTNGEGDTPKKQEELPEQVVTKLEWNEEINNVVAAEYAYPSAELTIGTYDEDERVPVYVDNPRYLTEETGYGVPPYKMLGSYKDGDLINLASGDSAQISYSVTLTNGTEVTSGVFNVTCPAGEESMGWFDWHTPSRAQQVKITLRSENDDLKLVDNAGNLCGTIVIRADIDKVEEVTPPDPKVTDTRPSWQRIYSAATVQDHVGEYAPVNSTQTLTWYTWTYSTDWSQTYESKDKRITVVCDGEIPSDDPHSPYPYSGLRTERRDISIMSWGVDNRYYANDRALRPVGRFNVGAVLISTNDIELEKVEYSVTVNADLSVSPSDHCYTATYSNSSGKYTMKSGYGIQVEINAHISGDTEFCTGSQTVNVLFPEFNYNQHSGTEYNRLLEKVNGSFVFKRNEYSSYNDRVHFTPIWYPDKKNYTVYAEVFDVWCPAGQLSVRLTGQVYIKGNVYDDWHVAPVKP